MTTYQGIDYGLGRTNVDKETGIRYGVISQHSLDPEVINDVVCEGADYGPPACPKCGSAAISADDFNPDDVDTLEEGQDAHDLPTYGHGCTDYVCIDCKHSLDSSEVFSEEPQGWSHEGDGYKLTDCLTNDVFVLASPFYTYAQFCSPCVPGAGNLDNPLDIGEPGLPQTAQQENHGYKPRVYALGHEWFESGKAPYRVFRVSDGSEVLA